jgi:hypothetical protein
MRGVGSGAVWKLSDFVILSVAELHRRNAQAQRRISSFTGLMRKPNCTTAGSLDCRFLMPTYD